MSSFIRMRVLSFMLGSSLLVLYGSILPAYGAELKAVESIFCNELGTKCLKLKSQQSFVSQNSSFATFRKASLVGFLNGKYFKRENLFVRVNLNTQTMIIYERNNNKMTEMVVNLKNFRVINYE